MLISLVAAIIYYDIACSSMGRAFLNFSSFHLKKKKQQYTHTHTHLYNPCPFLWMTLNTAARDTTFAF